MVAYDSELSLAHLESELRDFGRCNSVEVGAEAVAAILVVEDVHLMFLVVVLPDRFLV